MKQKVYADRVMSKKQYAEKKKQQKASLHLRRKEK
jgi:hypothetical protein